MISEKQGKKIAQEAYKWLGTPHRNAHKNLFIGVDCARLVEACIEGAELAPVGFVNLDTSYTYDWYLSKTSVNPLQPLLDEYFQEVTEMREGDVLGYQIGWHVSHLAVYVGNDSIIHSMTGRGCVLTGLDDYALYDKKGNSRLRKIYRLRRKIK